MRGCPVPVLRPTVLAGRGACPEPAGGCRAPAPAPRLVLPTCFNEYLMKVSTAGVSISWRWGDAAAGGVKLEGSPG